ncbi:MAG: flagellar hook-basal body complex protein, partial [Planctomycetaceae bacterium]|nr:flagellar hook-basal body complex protein [Planctomycetaceae bacterium]
MANSLLTGISGLRGHQKMLEVIGNNLANLNTTGFKSSRTIFSDLMYELQRGATSSTAGILGSVNALQIGTGSRVSLVDLNFTQGNLEATGQDLDVAMDGSGFFVAKSATGTYFTRAGSFSLDESGYLVDAGTGNLIQRFGSVGEPDGVNPSFQSKGDPRIYVPIGTSIPGQVTSEITVAGNLSSLSTGPVAQKLRSEYQFETAGGVADGSTLLNDLTYITTPFQSGDRILIQGTDHNNDQPTIDYLDVDGSTTVQNLIDALSTAFPGADITLDSSGYLIAESNETGPSQLEISLGNRPGNQGLLDFTKYNFVQVAVGKNEDSFFRSVEVYDERGAPRTVGMTFTKQANGTWNMEATIDPTEGTIIDGLVEGITFQSDGSFSQVLGTGLGDGSLSFQFNGNSNFQVINLDLGAPGSFEGL